MKKFLSFLQIATIIYPILMKVLPKKIAKKFKPVGKFLNFLADTHSGVSFKKTV